jgi:hypothetical protein
LKVSWHRKFAHLQSTNAPPSIAENDRGVRNWSAAQIVGPLTFVVDICVEVQCQLEIKRWIATSIHEVAQIQQSHKTFQWTQVFVSMRAPRCAPEGLVFEEINEVYQSGRFGSNIYRRDKRHGVHA